MQGGCKDLILHLNMEGLMTQISSVAISLKPTYEHFIKRLFDFTIALLLLLLLSPIIILLAILIRLDSPGPAIYKHVRIGKDGKPFDLYKFRSMTVGGEDKGYMDYLKQLIESSQSGSGGIPYRKMDGDPRITRIGSFLRKYYLDELPQFLNILRGEMSLVGPRPHVQFEVDYYTSEQRRRLSVRPGATGLWQVDGKADCCFNELIALDLEYIDHWSLAEDFRIIFKTVLLMGRGGESFWARMSKQVPIRTLRRNGSKKLVHPATTEPAKILTVLSQEDEG